MKFDDSYFEEEVIDGFYVSSMMKKCWAAHIVVLEDLDKVCQKYGIKYFADWGTLLGCVRNAGVIPWDDDFDVCMKREDYQKFLEIWEKELGGKYKLKCLQTQEDREDFLAKLVNISEFNGDFSRVDQFAGFPYGMGVDIFVLDYIAPDENEDVRLCKLYNDTAILAYKYKMNTVSEEEFRKELYDIENRAKKKIDCNKNIYNELNLLADSVYSEIPEESAKEITQIHIYTNKRKYRIPKQCYADSIYMDFEGIQIPVPIGYEEILRRKYGTYINPVRKGGSHGYPFYEEQEKWVVNVLGKKIGGFAESDIEKESIIRTDVKKELINVIDGLSKMHNILRNIKEFNSDSVMTVLSECQNLAVKVGNIIENTYGEDGIVINKLENYCEFLYEFSQKGKIEILNELDIELEEIKKELIILKKKTRKVIVIPYREKYFEGLKGIIEDYEKSGAAVSVMPIPYYVKNFFGVITSEYEPDSFCANIEKMGCEVVDYEKYDLASIHPDTIVIQNPFDDTNYSTTIAPMFYSNQLKKFCDELIYVSPFCKEVKMDDDRARIMCKDFINRPAVLYSDKIIVSSDDIKKMYIDSLVEFVGNNYKTVWEEKIIVVNTEKIITKNQGKKKIIYFVSFGEVIAYPEMIMDKIQRSIAVLQDNSDKIDWTLAIDEAIVNNDTLIDDNVLDGIHGMLGNNSLNVLVARTEDYTKYVEEYDAYYGDSGVLSNIFRSEKKPVMIETVSV